MFGWTRIVMLAAVAAAVAMATGVAGATSKPGSAPAGGSHMASAGKISTAAAGRAALLKAANLRTRAGAARYLRAIGVNPHHFVIQRGIRNYAGARCPGAAWSCTSTTHPVIQIASAGGSNTYTACVLQNSNVDGSPTAKKGATVNVTLNAHQSVSIQQDSAAGGNTVKGARLSDDCDATGSALTQTQTLSSSATGSVSI